MGSNKGPCNGCTERFLACSDNCPKDARGEYGYKAMKADIRKRKAAEKEYYKRRYEDYMRSEQKEAAQSNYARHKNGRKRGYIYGK